MSTTTPIDAELEIAVRESIAEAMGLEFDEVTPESTLFAELGAESIDLLDMLFRVERRTGHKVKVSDIAETLQGGIADDVFSDDNDVISQTGLEHLKSVLPRID
ncbi:acyl carrier protein, partial [Nocardia sp. BSTN01]|uniref:acyl carrier protein n=1 Tax=Nocardia sp. BSTN01 TaxID=2783665 RepID=UPI00189038DB